MLTNLDLTSKAATTTDATRMTASAPVVSPESPLEVPAVVEPPTLPEVVVAVVEPVVAVVEAAVAVGVVDVLAVVVEVLVVVVELPTVLDVLAIVVELVLGVDEALVVVAVVVVDGGKALRNTARMSDFGMRVGTVVPSE